MFYRTALVTGASSGMGRGLALRLAEHGAKVVLCARRREALEEVAEEIRVFGGDCVVAPLDVSDAEGTVATIRELDDQVGGLELVIANAGVGARGGGPESYSWENMREACATNFTGALATLTAVLPRMLERKRGHLVGMSSLAAYVPLPQSAAYCATKSGLSMFLECLRTDLMGTGVDVTAIHAGYVKTPLTERSSHPRPLMMERDEAVDTIMRRLIERPATIDFPVPLAVATRVAGRLPRRVRDAVWQRLRLERQPG